MSIPHKVDTRHARLGLAKGAPIGQQRRQYSPEFKADAVALVRSSGRSISAIAREFGIGESNLGYWLKKDEADRKTRDPERFATESTESAENRALRRRVAELEVEREILKRAGPTGTGLLPLHGLHFGHPFRGRAPDGGCPSKRRKPKITVIITAPVSRGPATEGTLGRSRVDRQAARLRG
jgi:transposase